MPWYMFAPETTAYSITPSLRATPLISNSREFPTRVVQILVGLRYTLPSRNDIRSIRKAGKTTRGTSTTLTMVRMCTSVETTLQSAMDVVTLRSDLTAAATALAAFVAAKTGAETAADSLRRRALHVSHLCASQCAIEKEKESQSRFPAFYF